MPTLIRLGGLLAIGFVIAANLAAEPVTSSVDEQMRFFETRIRPLLAQKCFECHADDKAEGGLRLDVIETISQGGDSGPVILPGDPAGSLLVSAVRYKDLEMPPDAPLSEEQQSDLEKWIEQGAYWPITESQAAGDSKREPWWAAEPINPGELPEPVPGVDSPTTIDRHIDHSLAAQGLHRAAVADRPRLIRRLAYDLLGLPPAPEEIESFVNDKGPDAYERLVERMFADPAYGDRMARLWLDLVRYADSDGWRADSYRPQLWRYRDFVSGAFNAKMPYDRFVAMQLAGDEIAPGDEQALAAVGYYRLGIYEFNQRDAEGQWQNIVDDITDVTADVFLATGIACAKCHDHKFDPIPRSDYFRLRSVFEPLVFVDSKLHQNQASDVANRVETLLAELREIEGDDVPNLRDKHLDRFLPELQAMYRKSPMERTSYEDQIAYLIDRQILDEGLGGGVIEKKIGKEREEKRKAILKELASLNADPYGDAELLTIVDSDGQIRPTRLPGRTQGVSYAPGPPTVFGKKTFEPTPPLDAPASSGRRSALAAWIVSPDNPITARVMVNRLWQYHFETGLVSGPNDFGRLGAPPTHPQLLDYLAKRFIDSGWSMQAIQREIVCSETYRQSAVNSDAAFAMNVDANNQWLWHKTVRRLDAEQYRDSLLVAMNSLIDEVGGPCVDGKVARRSIYIKRFRNAGDEILSALDAPPGIIATAKRDMTTTATQSLMMLNNARILDAVQKFAARVRRDVSELDGIDRAAELERATQFVRRAHIILTGVEPDQEIAVELLAPLVATGTSGEIAACHALLNSNAFLFVD